MKVIEEGRFPKIVATCNFDRCKAKVELTPADLLPPPPTKSPFIKFYFRCPVCGLKSEIPGQEVSSFFERTYEALNEYLKEDATFIP